MSGVVRSAIACCTIAAAVVFSTVASAQVATSDAATDFSELGAVDQRDPSQGATLGSGRVFDPFGVTFRSRFNFDPFGIRSLFGFGRFATTAAPSPAADAAVEDPVANESDATRSAALAPVIVVPTLPGSGGGAAPASIPLPPKRSPYRPPPRPGFDPP